MVSADKVIRQLLPNRCHFFLCNEYRLNGHTYRIATSNPNTRVGYFVSSLVGVIFGFVMNKARVIEPFVIRDQMVMSRFV